jgi:serine protease inhibitor
MKLPGLCSPFVPVALLTLACSDPNGPGSSTIDELPRQLTVSEQKLISGSNAFAFDLFHEINSAERSGNVFVSPLSASMALGMTLNGARTTTYDAMHSALRLGDASSTEVKEGYKSLISLLTGLDASTNIRIANSIWYQQDFPFSDAFIKEGQSYFDAEIKPVDFKVKASIDAINSWVSDATAKKIPSIIDNFDGDEVMFLVNAIYFKGTWKNQFDKSRTSNAPFFALDGSSANVPLMTQSATLGIAHAADYVAVDLPYGNSAFTMTVVLPNQGVDINAFAESMTQAKWDALQSSMHQQEVPLYLPRFKVTWKGKLNSNLEQLGMGIAFTDRADFSGMGPPPGALAITDVLQKTFVDVNEEGTEAAAATSVGIGPTSAPSPVRVDRPFIFAIRERFSGTILFLGKIAKLPA